MTQLGIDFGRRYRTARQALLDLLWDCGWHHRSQLESAAGNRYGARLRELRRLGYVIETREIEHGNEYRLTSTERGAPAAKRVKVFMDENDAASVALGLPSHAARVATADALASFRSNKGKL